MHLNANLFVCFYVTGVLTGTRHTRKVFARWLILDVIAAEVGLSIGDLSPSER